MKAAIIGMKKGMTSYFTENGTHVPCTVVEAGPCYVSQVKTNETDGYSAVQVTFNEKSDKNVNKPLMGHFKKAGVKPAYVLREFRDLKEDIKVGESLTVEQFQVGDLIKIKGTSKGKGFQGVMKRYNFKGVGMATHGQKNRQRHPGSVGQSSDPSRIMKGLRMAGRMGGESVTIANLEVVDVFPDKNIILVKGSVPGTRNSYLEIYK
ncbi:50S ribosomal protein L3 [bacterium]|nr:MAG: 50S ribosomal protein L3 [bacterium]